MNVELVPASNMLIIMGDYNASLIKSDLCLFTANYRANRNAPILEDFLQKHNFCKNQKRN